MKLQRANDCRSMNHKEMADMFWQELGRYVKTPDRQTLLNINYLWLWAVHDSHELAKTFTEALRWSGIDDIWSELEKQGWSENETD